MTKLRTILPPLLLALLLGQGQCQTTKAPTTTKAPATTPVPTQAATTAAPGTPATLSDCKLFSMLFQNTDYRADEFNSIAYVNSQLESCSSMSACPSGISNKRSTGGCEWNRKLKVTCSAYGTDVYIRVQTNSLPNHCFAYSNGSMSENQVDFKVRYNQPTSSLSAISFNSTSQSDLLCSGGLIQESRLASPTSAYNLQKNSGNTDRIVGVLLNGMVLWSGANPVT